MNEKDGFKLILICLKAVLPNLGAHPLNMMEDVQSITIKHGDTLSNAYSKIMSLEQRFEVSKQIYSPMLLVQHFVQLFMSHCDVHIKMSILPIHQQLQVHLTQKGADVPFHMKTNDIYDYLQTFGINGSYTFKQIFNNNQADSGHIQENFIASGPTNLEDFAPVANAAIGSKNTNYMIKHKQSDIVSRNQRLRCKICFCAHPETRCEGRGIDWVPMWIKKDATKYNAQHPHEKLDSEYIQSDPP